MSRQKYVNLCLSATLNLHVEWTIQENVKKNIYEGHFLQTFYVENQVLFQIMIFFFYLKSKKNIRVWQERVFKEILNSVYKCVIEKTDKQEGRERD